MEKYLGVTRAAVKDWAKPLVDHGAEWLIIVLTKRPETSMLGSKHLSRFASKVGDLLVDGVEEKLKGDFNSKVRDYVQGLLIGASSDEASARTNPQQMTVLTTRIITSITATFSKTVDTYDIECRNIDKKRMNADWNYLDFFLVKEGLALTYRRAGLLPEALMQYDELDALCFDQEARMQFGGTRPQDETSALLNQTAKLRLSIQQQHITIFELRQYLFTRQAQLLLRAGRYLDLLRRTLSFLRTMAKKMAANAILSQTISAWCFTGAKIILQTIPASQTRGESGPLLLSLNLLALHHLSALGELVGLLKDSDAISEPGNGPDLVLSFQDPKLNSYLMDKQLFDEQYLGLITQALHLQPAPRLSGWLRWKVGLLYLQRGNYAEAEKILQDSVSAFANSNWTELRVKQLDALALCQLRAGRRTDYLATLVQLANRQQPNDCAETLALIRSHSKSLEAPLCVNFHLASLKWETEQHVQLDKPWEILLSYHNPYNVPLELDAVEAVLSLGTAKLETFQEALAQPGLLRLVSAHLPTVLQPGKGRLVLTGEKGQPRRAGVYTLHFLSTRVGQVHLPLPVLMESALLVAPAVGPVKLTARGQHTLICANPQALPIQLELPEAAQLEVCHLRVFFDGKPYTTGPVEDVGFGKLEFHEDSLTLPIEKRSGWNLQIPFYSERPYKSHGKVSVDYQYDGGVFGISLEFSIKFKYAFQTTVRLAPGFMDVLGEVNIPEPALITDVRVAVAEPFAVAAVHSEVLVGQVLNPGEAFSLGVSLPPSSPKHAGTDLSAKLFVAYEFQGRQCSYESQHTAPYVSLAPELRLSCQHPSRGSVGELLEVTLLLEGEAPADAWCQVHTMNTFWLVDGWSRTRIQANSSLTLTLIPISAGYHPLPLITATRGGSETAGVLCQLTTLPVLVSPLPHVVSTTESGHP